jgi:hypothetical protein
MKQRSARELLHFHAERALGSVLPQSRVGGTDSLPRRVQNTREFLNGIVFAEPARNEAVLFRVSRRALLPHQPLLTGGFFLSLKRMCRVGLGYSSTGGIVDFRGICVRHPYAFTTHG